MAQCNVAPLSGLTRREWLGTALGATAAFALAEYASSGSSAYAAEVDPRVPALLDRALSIDMHTHAAGAGAASAPRYDLADHMKRGKMSAVCLCHSADGPVIHARVEGERIRQYRDPGVGELWGHTLRRLEFMDRLVSSGGMRRVLSPADLEAAKAAGQPALIGNIEGCQFVEGKLERVKTVYDRGIRQLQIVHYMPVAALGDQQTEEPKAGGLGPEGADIVRECNRLGIVVDVAHGTYEMVQQTAKVSSVPFILSHTGPSKGAPGRYSRRIGPAHAKLMADAGGVVGVWPNGYDFSGIGEWCEAIARVVDWAGVDHVGIGTDMEGGVREVWKDYADLPLVADGLLKQGFSPDDAVKLLGGNYMRVWRQVVQARAA